ncbi:hypothetical protein BV20DRAFT_264421 [Pilatotrama ljubarskyi]|nr:hypothetical protein BV20DRAFT_264421 [Pilatotrama ljubarskyi]
MEPDFVREQVKNIWRVVASNAKLISERKLSVLEGAFVDTAFVVNQVCSLHDAVSDSVNMHAAHGRDRQFVIMKPEFLNQQGRALQAVIEDSARLQDQSRTAFPGLRSLSDGFVLELVENLRDVVRDNATIALERQLQPNALSMCRPDSVFRLVASFQCALVGYFQQARSAAALQEHRLAAERACADSEARADAMSAEKAAAEAKIAELQASLAALQSEVDQLKADAKEAEDATQVRIFKLEEELASISSARLSCDPMVSHGSGYWTTAGVYSRNVLQSSKLEAELTSLREEHKNIIKTCEEQRDAAALAVRQVLVVVNEKQQLQTERDRLATEISDLHQAHQAFSLARAREHEKMIEETARLQGSLREHEAAANSKCEENKMLKAALDSVKADLHATNNQVSHHPPPAIILTKPNCSLANSYRDPMRQLEGHARRRHVAPCNRTGCSSTSRRSASGDRG